LPLINIFIEHLVNLIFHIKIYIRNKIHSHFNLVIEYLG
jgi:hypothetical protein